MAKIIDHKFGITIDCETTGSLWGDLPETVKRFQGISYAVVVFDAKTFEPVDTLYVEIKYDPLKYGWSLEAEKIHGLTRDYLKENGVSRQDAAMEIAEFLLEYFGPNPEIVVMGHNVDFDILFMKQLLEPDGLMFNIANIKLDTAGLGFVTVGINKSSDLFDLFGLPERKEHNALEDALYTLETTRLIREIFQSALES